MPSQDERFSYDLSFREEQDAVAQQAAAACERKIKELAAQIEDAKDKRIRELEAEVERLKAERDNSQRHGQELAGEVVRLHEALRRLHSHLEMREPSPTLEGNILVTVRVKPGHGMNMDLIEAMKEAAALVEGQDGTQ